MTGTNSIPVTNQTNQSITGFIPSWSTPGINSGFANSFAGDDVAYKQVDSNNLDNPKIDKGYYESSVKVNPKSKATGLELALTYHKGEELPKPSNSSKQGVVTTVVDVGTDLLLIVSNIKDADIAINGVNRVTGEKVGVGGRILSGFFALPVVGNIGKYIAKGGALIYKGVKSVSKGAEVTTGVVKSTKQVDSVATTGVKNLSGKNQKLFDDIYSKAPDAKREIDGLADEIAGSVNGKVAKAPIKSKDQAIEKIVNDYDGDPSKIKDLARNTIITSDKNIDSVVAQLKGKGANVKIIDGKSDPLGYSGVNTTVKTNTGLTGEIQVNTPEMIYAKEPESMARVLIGEDAYNAISSKTNVPGGQGHKFYEEWRKLNPDTQEAKSIASQSKAYYDSIRGSSHAN